MVREKYGEQCKLCTRPFTVFRWLPEKGGKYKKTTICLTCSRQKNCCQSCMMDLTFGLPLPIRDAALKMAGTSGSSNAITRQYIAQNFEGILQDGQVPDEYKNMSSQARDLLRNLSTAMPYYKQPKQQHQHHQQQSSSIHGTEDKALLADVQKLASKLPLNGSIRIPKDESITSFFISGIEDDLSETVIRNHFKEFGPIRSLVVVHRARCGFITFEQRSHAEAAASSIIDGKLVLNGCRLKVVWGKPRSLGTSNAQHAKLAGIIKRSSRLKKSGKQQISQRGYNNSEGHDAGTEEPGVALPPGQAAIKYKSQLE